MSTRYMHQEIRDLTTDITNYHSTSFIKQKIYIRPHICIHVVNVKTWRWLCIKAYSETEC